MSQTIKYLLILLSSVLIACQEGGELTRPIPGCSIAQQNQFVHEILLARYLYYQEVPSSIDYQGFASPELTLEALRFNPPDRFSNITDAETFNSLLSAGQFIGYGFSFDVQADDRVWIRFVYDDSPAGRSGMQRGNEILSVNGQTVQQIIQNNAWNTIFGPAQTGVPLEITLRDANATEFSLQLAKAVVNINTVLHRSIVSNGSEDVAYLVFNSFLQTSNTELEQVFSEFAGSNIRKLVLDMRYNGGGSVAVAAALGSYLFRSHQQDDIFSTLIQNDKNQSSNSVFRFRTLVHALDLDQLIVISTAATCSASEMIINGLRPFIDVRVVGNTTCGKPVGMNGFAFCDKLLLPVTFATLNNNNEGDYFDGLTPDCSVDDDVKFAFGDTDEPMLVEALNLSNTNSCSIGSRSKREPASAQPYPAASLRAIIGAY